MTSVADWSTTAASNTSVGGISTDGTVTLVKQLDNMIRGLMAEVATSRDDGTIFKIPYAAKSGNYTAVLADNNAVHRYTAAATVTLTAAATLGAKWTYSIIADGGDVIIDPNASETVNGFATITIQNGATAQVICDGSNFFTVIKPATWESIGVFNPSAAASVSITNLGSYRFLRITGTLTPSAGAQIIYRTSTNNGSSYDSGASDYPTQTLVGSGAVAGAASSTGTGGFITSQTAVAITFELLISNFNVAVASHASSRNATFLAAGNASELIMSARNQATARNALQILTVGGATLTGRLHLEGIRG